MKTLIAILLSIPSLSYAVFCETHTEKPNDPYYYVDSMFSTLKGFNKTTKILHTDKTADFVFAVTKAQPAMKCAVDELKPFTQSTNKKIAESAKSITSGLTAIIATYEGQVELLKQIEDGEITGSVNTSKKLGESANQSDAAWDLLAISVIGTSEVLIDDVQMKKDGEQRSLVITADQKKALIKKLEKDFKPKGKTEMKIEAVVKQYVTFLKDKWNTKK